MTALARCTGDGACPVRFRSGPPRPCVDHRNDGPGADAVRSEHCIHCTEAGVDDETAFLLHSDPQFPIPVTPPQQAAGAQRREAGPDGYEREVARLVDAGYSPATAKLGATPMIYR
jgi:hypothetical protein